MRGMGAGPLVSPDFFIILDRLFGTLDQRINHWYRQNKKFKGKFLGIGKKRRDLHNLMVERMTVAYDLAAAFFYLHENRYVISLLHLLWLFRMSGFFLWYVSVSSHTTPGACNLPVDAILLFSFKQKARVQGH